MRTRLACFPGMTAKFDSLMCREWLLPSSDSEPHHAPCQTWAIFWTHALAPRTPQNMLLMKCPAIAVGQAGQGRLSKDPI
eukprot:1142303-Pelagomonas_calceolata.AAC.1